MGFLGNIITATIKVAMIPIAIALDAVTMIIDPEKATHTKHLLNSAGKDAYKAIDDIT